MGCGNFQKELYSFALQRSYSEGEKYVELEGDYVEG